MMRAGSLFSGIGGFDLGLERAGLCRTVWQAESDRYCAEILTRRFPGTSNVGDVAAVDWSKLPPVDVLHGGFPCQDISEAGLHAGIRQGSRSGLWSYFADAVDVLRPRLVLVENVSALTVRGMDVVLGDLARLGFDARWASIRAADLGAPHRRERIFIAAVAPHARRQGPQGHRPTVTDRRPEPADDPPAPWRWGPYEPAVRRWGETLGRPAPQPVDERGRLTAEFAEWFMGFPDGWTSGVSHTRRLTVLGNAVVPQVAEAVGSWAAAAVQPLGPGCPYCAPDENCPDHELLRPSVY